MGGGSETFANGENNEARFCQFHMSVDLFFHGHAWTGVCSRTPNRACAVCSVVCSSTNFPSERALQFVSVIVLMCFYSAVQQM